MRPQFFVFAAAARGIVSKNGLIDLMPDNTPDGRSTYGA